MLFTQKWMLTTTFDLFILFFLLRLLLIIMNALDIGI